MSVFRITDEHMEIARLAALGKTNRAIGEVMFYSEDIISSKLRALYRHLGVADRASCTAYLVAMGYLHVSVKVRGKGHEHRHAAMQLVVDVVPEQTRRMRYQNRSWWKDPRSIEAVEHSAALSVSLTRSEGDTLETSAQGGYETLSVETGHAQ